MYAKEIRRANEGAQKFAAEAHSGAVQDVALTSIKVSMLAEIAAQLAEANAQRPTLRDQFAMAVIRSFDAEITDAGEMAARAYRTADAMLAAREARDGE